MQPSRALRAGTWVTSLAVGLAVVASLVLVVVAQRVWQVRQDAWEWGLSQSAAPPRIFFRERQYRRSNPGGIPFSGPSVPQGTTPGGGTILAPLADRLVPTLIGVRVGEDVVTYSLSGSP